MNSEIKLTKNMSVYGTDDSKLGDIKRVVVDPSNSEITHVVIEQGFIFTIDKVLPIEYIDRQQDGDLYVDRPADALDLRDYEETFYVNERNSDVIVDEEDVHPDASVIPTSVYYYPPLTSRRTGLYYWGMPGRYGGDPVKQVRRVNVPEGSLVIPEGTHVHSKDGEHVGDVHSVHMDEDNNRLTHFIISQGLLFNDYKLIPTFWIEEVNEDGIHLALNTDQLEELPAFEPETA